MSDWADEKAEKVIGEIALILPTRSVILKKDIAAAIREAQKRGREEAAKVSDECGNGEEASDDFGIGWQAACDQISSIIRSLSQQGDG